MRNGIETMKDGRSDLRYSLIALAVTGLAGLTFLAPVGARAENDSRTTIVETRAKNRTTTTITHDDWDDGWDNFDWTILQMQRESLSSQEEQAREAGRALRRDEIEKQQEKSSTEHEAYFDAILEDSQAALKAPLGAYYRKPGYSAAAGPGNEAGTIEVGGLTYIFDQGVFWLQQGSTFIVVTAPVGAVIDRLPQGVTRIQSRPAPVWYYFGTFFGEKGGAYEVLKPPAGLTVFYLPEGYIQEKVKGVGLYRFGDVLFKPVFIQGVLAYQVVEP
jgi:hypothetical protein